MIRDNLMSLLLMMIMAVAMVVDRFQGGALFLPFLLLLSFLSVEEEKVLTN